MIKVNGVEVDWVGMYDTNTLRVITKGGERKDIKVDSVTVSYEPQHIEVEALNFDSLKGRFTTTVILDNGNIRLIDYKYLSIYNIRVDVKEVKRIREIAVKEKGSLYVNIENKKGYIMEGIGFEKG